MSQHKATLRKSLRSALAHRSAADKILDSLLATQSSLNDALDKLDADDPMALATDYEATLAIADLFDADVNAAPAQHKATLRKSLRSALAHRRLADELVDAVEELQVAYNALLVKLDAQAGTLADTDFEATLAVAVVDAEASALPAQHKASARKSLRSAMAHRRLADVWIDAISGAQSAFNAALAQIDTGSITGDMAQYKVSPIDPDGI